jgi:hypothetical protein
MVRLKSEAQMLRRAIVQADRDLNEDVEHVLTIEFIII